MPQLNDPTELFFLTLQRLEYISSSIQKAVAAHASRNANFLDNPCKGAAGMADLNQCKGLIDGLRQFCENFLKVKNTHQRPEKLSTTNPRAQGS